MAARILLTGVFLERFLEEKLGTVNSPRVTIETLGCRSNYAQSIELQAALVEAGAVTCPLERAVDLYVLNSCTITDAADKEVFKLIRRARRVAPNAKVVVTGCLAKSDAALLESDEDVDRVVQPGDPTKTAYAILSVLPAFPRSLTSPESFPPLTAPLSEAIAGPAGYIGEVKSRARFHLRIQDGCTSRCTYCVIPKIKPRLTSRSVKLILQDLQFLAKRGFNEVVFTGTHLGWYEESGANFTDLLKIIAEKTPIPRIRLSSLDPNDLSPAIIDIIAGSGVFCQHLHICMQAFSDATLKRMNRRYRMEDARRILWYIIEKMPECCIGSDLIAGFAGESRQEVDEGIEEFLRLPISYLHVFPYSERRATAAVRLPGVIEPEERRRRAAQWREASEEKRAGYFRALTGKKLEVIVEKLDRSFAYGTSREYAFAKIPRFLSSGALRTELAIGAEVEATVCSFEVESRKLLCQ